MPKIKIDHRNTISHHTTTNEPEKNKPIDQTHQTLQNNTILHSQIYNKHNEKELYTPNSENQKFKEPKETENTTDHIVPSTLMKIDFQNTNSPVNPQNINNKTINHKQICTINNGTDSFKAIEHNESIRIKN